MLINMIPDNCTVYILGIRLTTSILTTNNNAKTKDSVVTQKLHITLYALKSAVTNTACCVPLARWWFTSNHTTTTILRTFFRDHPTNSVKALKATGRFTRKTDKKNATAYTTLACTEITGISSKPSLTYIVAEYKMPNCCRHCGTSVQWWWRRFYNFANKMQLQETTSICKQYK